MAGLDAPLAGVHSKAARSQPIPGLRDHEPRPKSAGGATTARLKLKPSNLISLAAKAGIGTPARPVRPATAGEPSEPNEPPPPPPIASVLDNAGLGHYRRKLVDDLSCTHLSQLLALKKPQLDALLDALRPLPGQRTRLLDFVSNERLQAASRKTAARAAGQPPPSASQRRAWQATVFQLLASAGKRGRDAPFSHTSLAQPLHWGHGDVPSRTDAGAARPPSRSAAYSSSVRVIKVGRNRVTVFDGPRPNTPAFATQAKQQALRTSRGPDADFF